MFETMLQGEIDSHLGYENNERGEKNTSNRRNGYSHKSVNTSYGKPDVSVPRDREGSFEPKAIPKHTKNCAVYVVVGYDADGRKDVLGLWIDESEGKHYWMQIFDEIWARGVEDVSKVYGAPSLKAAETEFERFKQVCAKYPGAVDVWVRNWQHVAQLYNYGSTVSRTENGKIFYTSFAMLVATFYCFHLT